MPSGLASLSSRTSVSSPSATSSEVSPPLRTPSAQERRLRRTRGQPALRSGEVPGRAPSTRTARTSHAPRTTDTVVRVPTTTEVPTRPEPCVWTDGSTLDAVRVAAGGRDADAVVDRARPAAVMPERWVARPSRVDQHDGLVERLGPRLVVEQRRGRGRVAEPRVQRRVAVERALERVVGAVVDDAHDAVVARSPLTIQPGAATATRSSATSTGSGSSAAVHTGWSAGQREPEHALGRPVRRPGAGVALRERPPGSVPAEGQQAVLVGRAVLRRSA